VPRAEEVIAHPRLCGGAHSLRAVRVCQQLADPRAEGGQVVRLHQPPGAPVLDLILNATDIGSDDRAALPHRLRHRQAESLGQALLDDDVGTALERVDDHGVLVRVAHRQQREVHPAAHRAREPLPGRLNLGEHLGAFRIVGHRGDVRTGEHEVRRLVGPDVLGEAGQHPERVLEAVPA
jgi:hypothetical protein